MAVDSWQLTVGEPEEGCQTSMLLTAIFYLPTAIRQPSTANYQLQSAIQNNELQKINLANCSLSIEPSGISIFTIP
jgi:hypothetical protein